MCLFAILSFPAYDPVGYQKDLIIHIVVAVSSFTGFKLLRQEAWVKKAFLGLFLGIILPPVIYFGYEINKKNKFTESCRNNPMPAFCEKLLSKEELTLWYEKNCEKQIRKNYHTYRCDDKISVPEEFIDLYLADEDKFNY